MSYPLAPLRRRRSACHVMNPHRRVSPASGTLNRSHMRVKMTTYTLARVSMRHVSPARITLERDRDGRMPGGPVSACLIDAGLSFAEDKPPNGSRLSCGRNARWRKAVERQTKRLAGDATQFLPQEHPAAASAAW